MLFSLYVHHGLRVISWDLKRTPPAWPGNEYKIPFREWLRMFRLYPFRFRLGDNYCKDYRYDLHIV